jgi:hypothetical protein
MHRKATIGSTAPNLSRHQAGCRICAHPNREEIERDFVDWVSPAKIAAEYTLVNRATVYRHAHALDLFSKRARNLRGALERIIEKAAEVEVTASAVVAAIQAYSKINAAGQWIERRELINLNDLFDRMSIEELEAYAKNGALPGWFIHTVGATYANGTEMNSRG